MPVGGDLPDAPFGEHFFRVVEDVDPYKKAPTKVSAVILKSHQHSTHIRLDKLEFDYP